jgi:EpsI family protein
MRPGKLRSLVLGLAMILAAILAVVATPKPIAKSEQPNLEALIPKQFGDWSIDPAIIPVLPSPDQQQVLQETYDQMVNRTYVNTKGERVMISIAYGSRQSQKLKAHRQEVCYKSQGFEVRNVVHQTAKVAGADITVTRMFAVSKQRQEPVTYWFTVGGQVVQSHLERLLVQVQYGITGTIPDGVLVRVSNISANEQAAYQQHLVFINTLLETMSPQSRRRFVGNAYY